MLFELYGLPSAGKSSVARLVHLQLGKARIDARRVYPVGFAQTMKRHPVIAVRGTILDARSRGAVGDRRLRRQLLGWWYTTEILRSAAAAPNTLLEEGVTKRLWGVSMASPGANVCDRRLHPWIVRGTVIISLEVEPQELVRRSLTRPRRRSGARTMAAADASWWSRAISLHESVLDLASRTCPVTRVDASHDLQSVADEVAGVIEEHAASEGGEN